MSFVEAYQVNSLQWKRESETEEYDDGQAGTLELGDPIGQSPSPAETKLGATVSEGKHLQVELKQAVLAVCLNLGNNSQGDKCKMEEAFFDPSTRHHERAMRKVMSNLAAQLNLIEEMTVLALPDPRQESMVSALQRARRASPHDQILFLYNDHGTLAPTSQGEIWVYDTDFPITPTTYNPVFVSSLVDAAQAGTVYLWDCDNAGCVIDCAVEHGKRRDQDYRQRSAHLPEGIPSQFSHTAYDVHFGVCATDQVLPVVDNLPRDVFTACMTMPLAMALRYHSLVDTLHLDGKLKDGKPSEANALDAIPGHVNDRSSPLGDLTWLFVNIIETIAWQSLPTEAFRALFRTSRALRALARGYILAQRVLRDFDCTPVSYPDIPSMHLHPLWQVWDTALEDFLCQLPIPIPIKGDAYAYRSPILYRELLQSIAGQLSLFANPNMNDASLDAASKLCANSLPIVFSACEGGRYRSCALNLLAKYLDIGGMQPVKWILRCGVLDILPAILKWASPHEASVAIFLLQRLMLSEDGPRLLVQPLDTLYKPPIDLLGDFICQHVSEDDISLSPDTVAGVLYLYSKAILDANWAQPDGIKAQFQQIFDIALDAEDSLVRTWASFALAACPPPDAEIQRKVRQLAAADPTQNVRTAACFAIWQWRAPEADCANGSLGEEDCDHIDFISQASKDASYLVRAFAFALAMDFVLSHQDKVVECIKQLAVNIDVTANEGNLSPHSSLEPIISTLVRGCRDPLHFLRKAVQDFLMRLWADERSCDTGSWGRVFPDMPQVMNTAKPAEKTQASDRSSTVGIAQDTLDAQTERPMMRLILAWRHRQECYFHETRLTWAVTEGDRLGSTIPKRNSGSSQLTAYEAGSRAMSSWTKESLEIQTSERAQLLQFHARVPVLAYGDSKGYRLFDYAKQRTIARRSLPVDERGISTLHFVDLGSPTLDVIELSAAGIVRVVKQIEEESFHEESQVVQGFRLGHYGRGEQFVASWNTIKLELWVGVGSRQSLQIWDLASAKRKADVMTGCAAGITCMDNESMRGNLSLLGFNDGTVALFDVRQQSRHCVARWPKGHSETVLSCCLTASQEIASIGKDGALNVWDLRVPNQPICTSSGLLQLPSRGLGAAAMSSTSVFAQLLQPLDGQSRTELSIRKLAFPSPAEVANIPLASSAFAESNAMVFHPQEARLAVAEGKKIVIRTARSER